MVGTAGTIQAWVGTAVVVIDLAVFTLVETAYLLIDELLYTDQHEVMYIAIYLESVFTVTLIIID